MESRRASRLLVGLLLASLVTAACGGDDSDTNQAAGKEGRPAAEALLPDFGSETPSAGAPDGGAEDPAAAPADAADPAADPAAAAPSTPAPAAPTPGSALTDPKKAAAAAPQPGRRAAANQPAPGRPTGPAPPKAAGGPAPAPAPAQPGKPAPGQPTATDVGVFPDHIKVGHIGIYSGPVQGVGDDIGWAGQAVLKWYNDNGGINGRKLDVLVRDDQWDGTKGMNQARDLVEREKIFGFCCIQTVPTNDLLGDYADKMKVPNVGGDGWGELQYGREWSWPTGASATVEGYTMAEYATKEVGVKTVSIFYFDSPQGRNFRDNVSKALEANGAKVVFSQAGSFDDPATSTYVARSRAENVDASFFWGEPGLWVKMIREAAIQAWKPPKSFWGCACLYFDEIPGLAGPWAEGSYAAVAWTPNEVAAADPSKAPGWAEYESILKKYYPKIRHSNWTRAGYAGGRLFGDTLKKLGLNVTRQGLKDTLDQTKELDLGLGAKLQWWYPSKRANHSMYLLKLQKDAENPQSGGMRFKYLAGPFEDKWNNPAKPVHNFGEN